MYLPLRGWREGERERRVESGSWRGEKGNELEDKLSDRLNWCVPALQSPGLWAAQDTTCLLQLHPTHITHHTPHISTKHPIPTFTRASLSMATLPSFRSRDSGRQSVTITWNTSCLKSRGTWNPNSSPKNGLGAETKGER